MIEACKLEADFPVFAKYKLCLNGLFAAANLLIAGWFVLANVTAPKRDYQVAVRIDAHGFNAGK